MAFTKTIAVRVLSDTWHTAPVPPQLLAAQHTRRYTIDVLSALAFTALWTRPPVRYGFSLSDCWAWLRYFPAICASPELRLREEWTPLDPHHKTVLSGDFGVGFTTWFLNRTLGLVKYSDTLWVVNTLQPGVFQLGPGAVRGPAKSPDYIAEDSNGNISVVECKGTQTSRRSLRDAIERGFPQKDNLTAIGATPIQHSLVAGLFVPQFESRERPAIVVADPDWPQLRDKLSGFSRDELGRGISQVAHAKELAMLNLPHSAGALVRAKGSAETITAAFAADAQAQAEDRSIAGGEVRVRREYIWPEPTKVADNLRIRGVRFEGILSEESVASLRTTPSPGEHGDRQRDKTRGVNWSAQAGDTSVRLKSPLGTTLTLTLLEP